MSERRRFLGLDVGGTKLAAGVVELGTDPWDGGALPPGADRWAEAAVAAGLRSFVVAPAHREEGPDAMIQRLLALGREALAAARVGAEDLVAVGVACGGPLDPATGVIRSPMNLPGWDGVPLGARVRAAFGRPAFVENDATAAILAEHRSGAGRGFDDLVYLTISTGIGGGAIVGGHLVRGATGNAAELGHTIAAPDGRPCACGRRGCLEGYASGTNIAARAREAIAAGAKSSLATLAGGPERITAASVVAGVEAGDALARRIWDDTIEALATGIASAINAFDPSVVILGGGVTRAGERLFGPLRRLAIERAMVPEAARIRIIPAALGDQLGVVGAAEVARERAPSAGDARTRGAEATLGEAALTEHLAAAAALAPILDRVEAVGDLLCETLAAGGRLVAFGNGGSAADAQHLAAELVGHFRRERRSLPASALTTDPSIVSAIANDYAWEDVFARQVESAVTPRDLVIGISTSGEAENVVRGLRAARRIGATTVALTGAGGGRVVREADHVLAMPSTATARIQELHTFVVHVLSEQVDRWAVATERDERETGVR